MWLVEAGNMRFLCDPLLTNEHHSGVFEVVPSRSIAPAALRPDVILISHRHPDHFDVRSLHQLAIYDPDSIVLTPDSLVARAAQELGFRSVHVVPPGEKLAFDEIALITTPSLSTEEWGVMMATGDGVVWNQVDTVFEDAGHIRQMIDASLKKLNALGLDLALVRWQPLQEVAAVLGHRTAFPYADYEQILAQVTAIDAKGLIPSSAGAAHTSPYAWLNKFVYPVSESRFLRDLNALCPSTSTFPTQIGSRYRVRDGLLFVEPNREVKLPICTKMERDPRVFKPFDIPPLTDFRHLGPRADEAQSRIRTWIHEDLAAGYLPSTFLCRTRLRFALS